MPTPRPLTLVNVVWKNLYRQPLRSCFTILGVSLGVVAIVTFTSLIQGVRDTIQSGLHLGGADLAIYQAGVAADILSSLDEDETRTKLLADPDVRHVAAGLGHVMPVGNQRITVVMGVEPDGFTHHLIEANGPPIRALDEASLGVMAARSFKKKVGDTINIGGRELRIVSVFNTGTIVYDAGITVHLKTLQEMLGREGRASAFFVDLRDGADVDAVAARLEAAIPEIVAIGSADEYHKVDNGLEVAQSAAWGVTLASVLIGSLIVLNTMWMTVLERTREIGVLRAVGWSRRRVLAATLLESLIVGAAALVVGALLGVGLAQFISVAPVASQFVKPTYSASTFGVAAAAVILLSVMGGALPAMRAARITPSEALRYE
ncbi:MAG: ABC transporter permease [Phycisphaerales bacterium]|nr:ABC transporter permease [Phycisphaerales bacterium]